MHPLKVVEKIYIHDGSLEWIYYDRDEKHLFLEIKLSHPDGVELEFNYGDSLRGLMTFFDVPEGSIDCVEDYNLLNHPLTSTDILSVQLMDANTVGFSIWYKSGMIPYLGFQSTGFTWEPHPCC